MSPGQEGILSVGLTGGIACGRSTVCGFLSRLGAFVVDMDEVAHRLMKPAGRAVGPISETFGPLYIDDKGGIDRDALGAAVFSDASLRGRLEKILHPLILEESERLVAGFSATTRRGIAITDAALLVETGGYRRYQRLVVVLCDPEVQLERLMRRDELGEAAARGRIAAQAPLEEKRRLADYVIDTSGTIEQTESRSRDLYSSLLEDLESLPDLPERRPS